MTPFDSVARVERRGTRDNCEGMFPGAAALYPGYGLVASQAMILSTPSTQLPP